MCRKNAITAEQIEQMKYSLVKRMANPKLTQDQLLVLREQYEYISANVRERTADELPILPGSWDEAVWSVER
jgi:hypothetical protein